MAITDVGDSETAAEDDVELAVRVAQLEEQNERLRTENAEMRKGFELMGWAGTLLTMAAAVPSRAAAPH